MDDMDRLRRILDEPPPTADEREAALAALRTRIDQEAAGKRRRQRVMRVGAMVATMVFVAGFVLVRQPPIGEAWSDTPVVPPDRALVAAAPGACGGPLTPDEVLLVDQRGSLALVLIGSRDPSGASTVRSCTLSEEGVGWALASNSALRVDSMSGSIDKDLSESEVERVIIDGSDGPVDVSYAEGFFLVWWPQNFALAGKTIKFLAADGSVLLEMPVRPSR